MPGARDVAPSALRPFSGRTAFWQHEDVLISKPVAEAIRAGRLAHPRVVSKELGVTISDEVGHQLSPRGTAYLAALEGT